ncbi:zona pellucida sperm-binding protein 4-like [Rhinophrynus dorsalis]
MDAPSPSECAAIQQEDRLSCANPPVSRDLCERLGCCFSSTDSTLPCYFGNKVTAQCTAANNVRVAISKEVTSPSLRLDSVRVLGVDQTSCREFTISKTNSFIMFKFPLSCGSMKQMEDDVILYENTFEASREIRTWRGNSITRDSTMKLTVRCSYPRTGIVPLLKVEVFTLPPPLPFSTSGPLLLEMRIARDSEYNSYYGDGDYPVVKVLRDPVFLEVRILQRTDPSLILVLNQCWATPSLSSTQTPQWPVLEDRCPYTGDNYLTRLIPVPDSAQNVNFPSHYKRFSISTFTFVDERTQLSLGGLVYFHCSASVCVPSASESCMARCAKRKRRMMETLVSEDLMRNLVTSNGPVYFTGDRKKSSIHIKGDGMFDHSIMEWVRGAAAAGGILVVVLAVMALWKYRQNKRTTILSASGLDFQQISFRQAVLG